MACFNVKTLIDVKGFQVFRVMSVSFPDLSQKSAKINLGGDHIMYCILY